MRDREFYQALPYAATGLATGVWRYYKPELMLGALTASTIAYDLLCAPGGTVSEAVDGIIEKHPIATRVAIGTVALHLANAIPEQLDPISRAFKRIKSHQ